MPTESTDGLAAFAAELTRFAETVPMARLSTIIAQMRHPVRVAVRGRRGVGRSTVEQALRGRGVHIADEASAEVRVLTIAEVHKPEDEAAIASSELPMVIVLTKADLSGSHAGVPMIGLLAMVTALDDDLVAALRRFVDEPPDLSSVDAFIESAHSVDCDVRTRLLDLLDRFGITNATAALAAGAPPTAVVERLQQLSNVDGVLARLHAVAAPVRYRRVQQALGGLRALAAATDDERVWRFLAADATVTAVMAAAVDVLEGPGAAVDGALHQACVADAVRGSLRLLDQA
jgi:hypothetical protein